MSPHETPSLRTSSTNTSPEAPPAGAAVLAACGNAGDGVVVADTSDLAFSLAVIATIAPHRHWDRAMAVVG